MFRYLADLPLDFLVFFKKLVEQHRIDLLVPDCLRLALFITGNEVGINFFHFLSNEPKIPVVGLVLVHPQKEYADPKHEAAHAAIDRLLSAANVSTVPIDTRLDDNTTGWRNAAQVESLIAKTDVVVTTRLHGTVLALKNGVPALVIDPIAGGAKIRRQCATIGWPLVFDADELDDAKLAEAFAYCLTKAARIAARACAARATAMAEGVRDRFREDARHARNFQKNTKTEAQ